MYEARLENLLKAMKAGSKTEIENAARAFDTSGELDVSKPTADDKRLAGFLLDHIATLRRSINSVEMLEKIGRLKTILGTNGARSSIYTPKLRMRLQRFSFEEIEQAAKNIAANQFMMGAEDGEKKATLEYLLRNDAQIDKWLTKTNGNGHSKKITADDLKQIKSEAYGDRQMLH